MKRFRFVAALSASPLVVACGTIGVPQAQAYATVFGRVYDAASNVPVGGVKITVDSVIFVTSGVDGSYSAANVPLGPTDVNLTPPPGYAIVSAGTLNFSVSSGERYRLDIALTKTS
jgi:hypothetical protein